MNRFQCKNFPVLFLFFLKVFSIFQQSFSFAEKGNAEPIGHLKPLGSHMPPESSVDELQVLPTSEIFHKEYVKPGKPLIFKGAAKLMPAFKLWTDDYLSSQFGDWDVEVEMGKKENRSGSARHLPFKSFLDVYKNSDIYLVEDINDDNPMTEDLCVLKPLLCGGFMRGLQTVVIWFSGGGTSSVLHNDGVDNINCLFDGEKKLVMFDKKYNTEIEGTNFVKREGYSKLNVDKVDLLTYSEFQTLPWVEANMEKGDCMFIPYRWYHQVRSYGNRNIAVNVWFAHMLRFDADDCKQEEPLPDVRKLSEFEIESSNEALRVHIIERLGDKVDITLEDLIETLRAEDIGAEEDAAEIFGLMDRNNDAILDKDELLTFDVDQLVAEFPDIFGNYEDDNPDEESIEDENEDENDIAKDEL
ncbi:unnamed protein product [Owenia fusiformis]|uniref:Uncharacterized protein n=1 Tax=Owenia fusiformis TaxID=6347 RepID=A0A8J1TXJ6_OWEFU|nr:unnamed protein product [Owenia fusiformis]